ncbi:restriction endonuclease [Clostridium sp. D2Q-11]|uniref:Restriction endonuclease n=2 Tax=Anaeromonas frigoriresistens TaxID=2683708 RepID=A0A942Z7K0_9FIRM|nr:restriction endonuclease [Anaeromonas frigoriresistens]
MKKGNKGGLGQLLEKYYFQYQLNSDSEPDFKEAGVELKVTPFKKNKSKKKPFSAKERLVLNIINFETIVYETFHNSSFLNKNKLLLLIFYLHDFDIPNKLDFLIKYVQLFEYPHEDFKIIEQDWNTIVNKIKLGKAHELSEGDTMYLGACTKGSKKADSYRVQPFSDIKAPQRALSLKSTYMNYILRNYILKHKTTYEPIIKDKSILENQTFEEYIVNKISEHHGKSIDTLCEEFNVSKSAKQKTTQVALKILGLKSNKAEEFEKANIKMKSIRIQSNGRIKEHMSFPTFKFIELIKEDWETSTFRTMLEETKFFFIIYKFNSNNELILERTMFWNMPINILDTEVKYVWEKTVKIINDGVKLEKVGKRTFNNLPSASKNPVSHVRPHGKDGSDTYPLPDGRDMPKQSFWLNNSFILEQILENGDNYD